MDNQDDKPDLAEMKEKIRKKAYTGFLIDTPLGYFGESIADFLSSRRVP